MCCSDKEHNNYKSEGDNIVPTCKTNSPSAALTIVNAGVVFALVPLFLSMALTNWGRPREMPLPAGPRTKEIRLRSNWKSGFGCGRRVCLAALGCISSGFS